jgi:hypothetical protein
MLNSDRRYAVSEFANAFSRTLTGPSTTARIVIASNQPDGIVLYGTGSLSKFNDQQIRGEHITSLFSDRTLPVPDPSGPFVSTQPFSIRAPQDGQIALISSDGASFRLIFTLYNPFNRTYDMNLTLVGDVAYGTCPAIGGNEGRYRALYTFTLSASALT